MTDVIDLLTDQVFELKGELLATKIMLVAVMARLEALEPGFMDPIEDQVVAVPEFRPNNETNVSATATVTQLHDYLRSARECVRSTGHRG